MQFGYVERPTHFNTSHDLARYEVPGHKWADLSEHGFGVALLSESKYGFSTFGNCMRMSLLRSPTYPDPQADIGEHHFGYALMPHRGNWRDGGVVAESYRFNVRVLFACGLAEQKSFASIEDQGGNLVLETIKKAEDSDAIVARIYEAHGGRGIGRLKLDLGRTVKWARFCNILEDELEPAKVRDGAIEVPYGPHQIISVLVSI